MLLDSFRFMNENDTSALPKFDDILSVVKQWTPYIHKHNKQDAEDAKNDIFVRAVDNYEKKKHILSPYMVKSVKHFKSTNKLHNSDLIENMELFLSSDLDFLAKKTLDSTVVGDSAQEEISNFLTDSAYKEPLEFLLLTNAKDFVFLMEDLIYKDASKKYRSTGIPKKDIALYFENPDFIPTLAEIAYETTGFLIVLLYYYTNYKEIYKEVASENNKDYLNNYIIEYSTRMCYILDDTVTNKSIYKKTFCINREELIDNIFDALFDEDAEKSLAYTFEGKTYYRLLDNNFYYDNISYEPILKTQIRNIVLNSLENVGAKYLGEVGNYDVFVSKEIIQYQLRVSLGTCNFTIDFEFI